jgi:hypothetical protein
MASQLEPVEICCDAPPYPIVRASRHVPLQTPEDVRWLRMTTFHGQEARLFSPFWEMLWGRGKQEARTCTCGQPLPGLKLVEFTFITGNKAAYLLGQCCQCRTVFWNEL